MTAPGPSSWALCPRADLAARSMRRCHVMPCGITYDAHWVLRWYTNRVHPIATVILHRDGECSVAGVHARSLRKTRCSALAWFLEPLAVIRHGLCTGFRTGPYGENPHCTGFPYRDPDNPCTQHSHGFARVSAWVQSCQSTFGRPSGCRKPKAAFRSFLRHEHSVQPAANNAFSATS